MILEQISNTRDKQLNDKVVKNIKLLQLEAVFKKYQDSFKTLSDIELFSNSSINENEKIYVLNSIPNEMYVKLIRNIDDIVLFTELKIDEQKRSEIVNSIPNEKYHQFFNHVWSMGFILGMNYGEEWFFGLTHTGLNIEEKKKIEIVNSFPIKKYCELLPDFEDLVVFAQLNINSKIKNGVINSIPNEHFQELLSEIEHIDSFLKFDIDAFKKNEVISSIPDQIYFDLCTSPEEIGKFLKLDIDNEQKVRVLNLVIKTQLAYIENKYVLLDVINMLSSIDIPNEKFALSILKSIKPTIMRNIAESITHGEEKSSGEDRSNSKEKSNIKVIQNITTLENKTCKNYSPINFYLWLINLTQKSFSRETDGNKLSVDEKLSLINGIASIHSFDLKQRMSTEFTNMMQDDKKQILWQSLNNNLLNSKVSESSIPLSLSLSNNFYTTKDESKDLEVLEKFLKLTNGRYIRKYGENSNQLMRNLFTLAEIKNMDERKDSLGIIVDKSKNDKDLLKNMQDAAMFLSFFPSDFNPKVLLDCYKIGFDEIFKKKVDTLFKMPENYKGDLWELMRSFRQPDAPVIYLSRMNGYQEVQNVITDFMISMMENNFYEKRYDLSNSEHLKKIFAHKEDLLTEWKKGLITENFNEKGSKKVFSVEDTDNPVDLFLCGTEVTGSCQRVDGSPILSKCLMAYVIDGKNRAIIVRDTNSEKIVARSIFRILWDEKNDQPVLMLEKKYSAPGSSFEHGNWIKDMAKERAKKLNILLVSKEYYEKDSKIFSNPLRSFDSPAPYEYVDSFGGVTTGKFVEDNSRFNILYEPSKEAKEPEHPEFHHQINDLNKTVCRKLQCTI